MQRGSARRRFATALAVVRQWKYEVYRSTVSRAALQAPPPKSRMVRHGSPCAIWMAPQGTRSSDPKPFRLLSQPSLHSDRARSSIPVHHHCHASRNPAVASCVHCARLSQDVRQEERHPGRKKSLRLCTLCVKHRRLLTLPIQLSSRPRHVL